MKEQFIDQNCDLDVVAELKKEGVTVPCLINERGDELQFVFFWEVQPIHATKIEDQSMASILDGIREIQGLEQLTFINTIQPSVSGEPVPDLLAINDHDHKEALSKAGLRREITYRFTSTHTVSSDALEPDGPLEWVLGKGSRFWESRMSQTKGDQDRSNNAAALNGAHAQWLEMSQQLTGKFRLTAQSMDADSIYEYIWHLFNSEPCPGLPYRLVANLDTGDIEEIDKNGNPIEEGDCYELISYLIPPNSCPKCGTRDYLDLPGRNRFVASISFEDIPDDFGSPLRKYRYLWDAVILDSTHPYEMEIVSQVTYADPRDSLKQSRKFAQQQKGGLKNNDKKGKEDRTLAINAQEATAAQDDMLQGDLPCFIATVINVYAPTKEALNKTCRKIRNRFTRPAIAYRESDYAWKFWLQSTPIRMEPLATSGDGPLKLIRNDYRLKIPSSSAIGMIQMIGIRSTKKIGIEFISKEGGIPVYVPLEDEFGNPRHGVQYGLSGSGKSASFINQLDYARLRGMKLSIQDLPDASGRGSYQAWVDHHGGVIIDTARTPNNLLELPEFKDPASERDYYADVEQIISSLVINRESDRLPLDEIESLISTSVYRYYQNAGIRARIEAAKAGGLGSDAWKDYPTLRDYYEQINDSLNPENSEKTQEAINHIRLRLRSWIDSAYGELIAVPSVVDINSPQILLFSLRGIKGKKEAQVFGLSSFNAAMRRSISADRSFYGCDEASVQLEFDRIALYVGQSLATMRKAGGSVFLLTQDCEAIEDCAASAKIKNNLSYLIIGRVANGAIDSYVRVHKIPPELIAANASESFMPNRQLMATDWLIDDNGLRTAVRSFASPIKLGLVANSVAEDKMRKEFFRRYPNPDEAAARFGHYLASQFKQDLGAGETKKEKASRKTVTAK